MFEKQLVCLCPESCFKIKCSSLAAEDAKDDVKNISSVEEPKKDLAPNP